MKTELKVTFRGMEPSEAMDARIRGEVSRLEEVFDGIVACHVWVEEPHHHHRKGNHFQVRVELTVPGREITAGRHPTANADDENPYTSLEEAFQAARRQLHSYAEELHQHR